MKKNQVVLHLFIFLLVAVLAYFFYQGVIAFFQRDEIVQEDMPLVIREVPFLFQVYIQCFIFLYALLAIPVAMPWFIPRFKFTSKNKWNVLLILEVFAWILAYSVTPKDLASTLVYFFGWQIVALVYVFVLVFKVKQD